MVDELMGFYHVAGHHWSPTVKNYLVTSEVYKGALRVRGHSIMQLANQM